VIQAILRQPNVNVTLGYCINSQTPDVAAAMGKLKAEIAAHDFVTPIGHRVQCLNP
jgi:hypothetical protein